MVAQKQKKRVIYVYPPLRMAESWRELAERQGFTLSRFVIEHVENSVRQEEDPAYGPRSDLVRKNKELEEALAQARKETRLLNMVVDKLEKENRRLRVGPFIENGYTGIRRYESELIELLMKGQTLNDEQIFSRNGATPVSMVTMA